ncbi:MAG: hypothetical protein KGL68_01380 [Burkholderiales bacterium]|nr:hypothetical protein [Burkholderiales bacterium]
MPTLADAPPRKAMLRVLAAALALAWASPAGAQAQDWKEFSSRGLPGSAGVVVRVRHPAAWKRVDTDDPMALAELRGPEGGVTGILQVGRGQRRDDLAAVCKPEHARTMLQRAGEQPGVQVTDVFARQHEGRPAFEIHYERDAPPDHLLVRSLVVCLKDTRLVVSCGATGQDRTKLGAIEPVCRQVLESLTVTEQ